MEHAQALTRIIEEADAPASTPERKDEPVSVVQAVTEYLADAKARELSEATVYKLDIFFRKQFLTWCKAEGYKLLREIDLRAVQSFRASWKDGAMAKKKKQERLTGFFWFCIRAGWMTSNPINSLGRISVTQAPTDYFNHIRTVPMPIWVKAIVDGWLTAAGVTDGKVFRAVSRHGTSWGKGISENVIWYVVRNCAARAHLDHLAPHDLRRTCAKLCHMNGGELEQIQFLLGHASVLTTERYLGCKQNLEEPVNDRFGCLVPNRLDLR